MTTHHDDPAPPTSSDAVDECASGDCDGVLTKLEAFLDGELPEASLGDLSTHLADCYPCADRRDFESQLRAVVKNGCGGSAAPEDLLAKVRARIAADAAARGAQV